MADTQTAIKDFLTKVAADTGASVQVKQEASTLSNVLGGPIYQNDIWIYRIVILVLGITVLATIIGGLGLAFKGDQNYKLPAEIVAIGSACVGALAGLLAPSPVKTP
jgi:hypothetical protein